MTPQEMQARMDTAYYRTLAETNARKGLGKWPVVKPAEPDPPVDQRKVVLYKCQDKPERLKSLPEDTMAQRIIKRRFALGMTKVQLATRCTCGPKMIAQFERGRLVLDEKMLERLGKALKTSAKWLMEGVE